MTMVELTGAEDVAWDLSDLYNGLDDPRIESDLTQAEADADAFRARYHGNVAGLSASELAEAITEHERIESSVTRTAYFAHLLFSTNMAESARGALVAHVQERAATLDTQLLFFGLEWAALDEVAAEERLADPSLDAWRHHLESLRKFRPYLLSELEERVFTEKSVSGMSSWSRLYEEQLGAIRVEIDGETVGLESAMARLYAGDRDVRRAAAEGVTVALEPGLRTRTFIFNTILLDKSIDDRLRGYPTWITARNLSNETTDEAVQALIDAAVSRYDVPQRYYRLKARLLGIDRLHHFDRFAPLGQDTTSTSWNAAREITQGAYADFSTEAGDIVERFFASGWIDAAVGPTSAPVPSARRPSPMCTRTSS